MVTVSQITKKIKNHPQNAVMKTKGLEPVFTADPKAKIVIIGQAPGVRAQAGNKPWSDLSGEQLRRWLDVSYEDFYNPKKISLMPMDFYFPGKGKSGDLPPRKGFAELWHPPLLELMDNIELTILIGQYSQKHYLDNKTKNLTETVKSFKEYLPDYFPLPHPSPRNNIWKKKNPWFEEEVIPALRKRVHKILN